MRTIGRALVLVPGFLLGVFLLSYGARFATWGIGIVIFALGLGLILPRQGLKASLHIAGVAHHRLGDPTGPAGVGAVLHSDSGEVLGYVERGIGFTTNTIADYAALIGGLELALDKDVTEVDVYVDSALVAGHLVDGYRVRADHLRPLVEHTRQLLDRFSDWTLTRIPRTSNVDADLLALRGIEQSVARAQLALR